METGGRGRHRRCICQEPHTGREGLAQLTNAIVDDVDHEWVEHCPGPHERLEVRQVTYRVGSEAKEWRGTEGRRERQRESNKAKLPFFSSQELHSVLTFTIVGPRHEQRHQ